MIHDEIDVFGDRLDALAEVLTDPAEVYAASLRHLVLHAITDPLWGRFYVQLGVAHPLVLKVLGPRSRRDLEAGIAGGRMEVGDVDLAVACTFGALASVIDLVTSAGGERPGIEREYAQAMLCMVGIGVSEAAEIVARPLPDLIDPAQP